MNVNRAPGADNSSGGLGGAQSTSADMAAAAAGPASSSSSSNSPSTNAYGGGSGGGGGGGRVAAAASSTVARPPYAYGSAEAQVTQNGQIKLTIKYKDENGADKEITRTLNVKVGGQVVRDPDAVARVAQTFNETLVFENMAMEFLRNQAEHATHTVTRPSRERSPLSFSLTPGGFTVTRIHPTLDTPGSPGTSRSVDFRTEGTMTGSRAIDSVAYEGLVQRRSRTIEQVREKFKMHKTSKDRLLEVLPRHEDGGYASHKVVKALKKILENDPLPPILLRSVGIPLGRLDSDATLKEFLELPENKGLKSALEERLAEAQKDAQRTSDRLSLLRSDVPLHRGSPLIKMIKDITRENSTVASGSSTRVAAAGDDTDMTLEEIEAAEPASTFRVGTAVTVRTYEDFAADATERRTRDVFNATVGGGSGANGAQPAPAPSSNASGRDAVSRAPLAADAAPTGTRSTRRTSAPLASAAQPTASSSVTAMSGAASGGGGGGGVGSANSDNAGGAAAAGSPP